MRHAIHEILSMVRGAPTEDAKVALLRKHDSAPLRTILRYAYDPRLTWILPEGDPPYKPLHKDEHIGSEFLLLKEARTLYLFVTGAEESNPNLRPARREHLFVELLQSAHPEDAVAILQAKNRKIPGVPSDLVLTAFPGLYPGVAAVQKVVRVVAEATGIESSRERRNRKRREQAAAARAAREAEKMNARADQLAVDLHEANKSQSVERPNAVLPAAQQEDR